MVDKKSVTIVGGGPVGALQACYLSKNGFKVDLYESRKDIRNTKNASGRSINLALSFRGIQALRKVGLDEQVISLGLPMHGRMIHKINGSCYPVPYGKSGQHLLSVDRMHLNRHLLSAASLCDNVTLHFQHRLTSCDLKTATATFINQEGEAVNTSSDAIFACDGAHSTVRAHMQRHIFDYSQEFIPHGYKELTIPPSKSGEFAIPKGYLHIWPRHEYMLIALPNQDKSFTCTMFMPFGIFEKLKTENDVVSFFEEVFPDCISLIGKELLHKDFFQLPPLPIISVKSFPYNYKDKVVLLGDAAHACVPFYGQGLNMGLEDVLVMDEILEKHHFDFEKAFQEYSDKRSRDGHAVSELSKQNYLEMRSSVLSPWFLFRKKLDNVLSYLLPSLFIPKYEMVAFTRIRHHKVIEYSKKQAKWINVALVLTCFGVALGVILLYTKHKGVLKAHWMSAKGWLLPNSDFLYNEM